MAEDNTDINTGELPEVDSYGMYGSRPNKKEIDPYEEQYNIFNQADQDYIKSLTGVENKYQTQAAAGGLTNEDYYPSGKESGIAQMMQMGDIATMPLFNTDVLFPYAVIDENTRQRELAESAEHQKYLLSLNDNYFNIKDKLQDELWIPEQMKRFMDYRKPFIDKFGPVEGNIMAKNSAGYKALTMQNINYTRAINENYDEMNKVLIEKADPKTKHFISDSLYKAAQEGLNYAHNEVKLPKLEDANNAMAKFTKLRATNAVIKPVAEQLSKNIKEGFIKDKNIKDTNITDVWLKEKKTGLGALNENIEIIGNRLYDENYKIAQGIEGIDKPSRKDFINDLKTMTLDNVEYELQKISKDNASEKAYWDLWTFGQKKELEKPEIDFNRSSIKFGDKTYSGDVADVTGVAKGNNNVVTLNLTTNNPDYDPTAPKNANNMPTVTLNGNFSIGKIIKKDDGGVSALVYQINNIPIRDDNGKLLRFEKQIDANNSYLVPYSQVRGTIQSNFPSIDEKIEDEDEYIETSSKVDNQSATPTNVQTGNIR